MKQRVGRLLHFFYAHKSGIKQKFLECKKLRFHLG